MPWPSKASHSTTWAIWGGTKVEGEVMVATTARAVRVGTRAGDTIIKAHKGDMIVDIILVVLLL